MPKPTDKKGVQRLLGMVTYLARYIPNLSQITHPIRELLHKKNEFIWTHEQDKAFDGIKKILTSDTVLTHYNVNEMVEVHCDASQNGLGACLMQNDKPVAYASRSLTTTEMNYANIEKELLSIVFGLERFNQYVYGKHITVYTDHRPLVPLSTKPIHSTPARVQRLLLRLQKYDYKLIYKPGKYHIIPDTLSRATIDHPHDIQLESECELNVHMVIDQIKGSDSMKGKIQTETSLDSCLSKVLEYIKSGWPIDIKNCDSKAILYWSVKDKLSIFENMILYENRIVIPKILQPDILMKIHSSHQGRVRCKALARQGVYWRNINSDIDNIVQKCSKCLESRKFPDKVELKPHEVPHRPFEKVGADIVTVRGVKYQVVVCYFSKWIELSKLPSNPKSEDLIKHFKCIFSRFGIPELVFSDRERVYKCQLMDKFCNEFQISKEFSSAMYSQSNGQVERAIGHVKNIVKRCNGNMCDIRMCLLDYHATPLDSNLGSPHNILMNRSVRVKVPCISSKLITKNDVENRKLLIERQDLCAKYYNRTAKKSKVNFKSGEIVVYRNNSADRDWKRAKVIDADAEFRSYTLMNTRGNLITRNSAMMLPDDTGREFAVIPDHFYEPVQSPSPQPIPTNLAPKSIVPRTPPQPKVLIPSTKISPQKTKELKLRQYAERHNTKVLPPNTSKTPVRLSERESRAIVQVPVRRSERLAASSSRTAVGSSERFAPTTVQPVRRSERLAERGT